MIFASDLDRTLIYSTKFIDLTQKGIKLVESKEGREITYMTEKTLQLLKSVSNEILFIPVTTRTIEEFSRITIFKKEIIPKYAIVSNGGNILMDGKLDDEWSNHIKKKIANDSLALEDVIKEFKKIQTDKWIKKLRIADNLFIYSIMDNDFIPKYELKEFGKWMEKNNWRTIVHGKKLYFLPKCVNKRDAVKYIAEKEEIKKIVAAGDSFLDLDILDITKEFFSPLHGDIFKFHNEEQEKRKIRFTKGHGILASEEIVTWVKESIIKK